MKPIPIALALLLALPTLALTGGIAPVDAGYAYELRQGDKVLVRAIAATPDAAQAALRLSAQAFAQFGHPASGFLTMEEHHRINYGGRPIAIGAHVMRHAIPCQRANAKDWPVVVASAIAGDGGLVVAQVGMIRSAAAISRGSRFHWRIRAQGGKVLATGGGEQGMDCLQAHVAALAALAGDLTAP